MRHEIETHVLMTTEPQQEMQYYEIQTLRDPQILIVVNQRTVMPNLSLAVGLDRTSDDHIGQASRNVYSISLGHTAENVAYHITKIQKPLSVLKSILTSYD